MRCFLVYFTLTVLCWGWLYPAWVRAYPGHRFEDALFTLVYAVLWPLGVVLMLAHPPGASRGEYKLWRGWRLPGMEVYLLGGPQ